MKRRKSFQSAKDQWDQLPPELRIFLINGGIKMVEKIWEKIKQGEIKFPDFNFPKFRFSKKKSPSLKSENIIVLPDFPDDRDPWWMVLKIKHYATEHEVHAAYEKLLAKRHPKKTGKVSSRTLRERARKAARLQQAYDDALESLKRRE